MKKLSIIAVLGCVTAYAVGHVQVPAMSSLSFDMPVGGLPLSGWLFFGGVIAVLVVLLLAMDYLSKASDAVWRRIVPSLGPVALVILVIAGLAMAVGR
jgi:hypothetical protein